MNAYLQQFPTVKLSPRLATEMPQFMLLKHYQTGVLTGRLFVPAAWARLKSFQHWLSSVEVIWTKHLGNGYLTMWVVTSHNEYERLLKTYPHHNQFNRGKSWEYLRAVETVTPVAEVKVIAQPATPVTKVVEQFTGYAEPVVEIEEPEDLTLGVDTEIEAEVIEVVKATQWEIKTRGQLKAMTKEQLYAYAKSLSDNQTASPHITKKDKKADMIVKIENWLAINS
ncbi:MAG TPA: hypothetical protein V6D19_05405 [Stenomitos sp.]